MTRTNPEQACRKYREAASLGDIGFDVEKLRELGWKCGPIDPKEVQEPRRYADFRRYFVPASLLICAFVVVGYFAPEIVEMIPFFDEVKP
ncbi:hypothetical protein [Thalassospira lohafexi]|uniref:Uncharacterized protein n=1 Tax=Thalassospira lohafexi TaxID=744227 RepID=A0A2N3L0P6_9PROT|nr:hypothetical protein [Thalassospira lohafexi]PKR56378.1 hypothetical protein COO92_21475 [Thalassospira lohafexi]